MMFGYSAWLMSFQGPSRTKPRSFIAKNHVQQLQFIIFQEPSEMRNRHNRRLAHVHSVKENTRKLRFRSKQKLENFRVLAGDQSLGSGAADQKSQNPRVRARR